MTPYVGFKDPVRIPEMYVGWVFTYVGFKDPVRIPGMYAGWGFS